MIAFWVAIKKNSGTLTRIRILATYHVDFCVRNSWLLHASRRPPPSVTRLPGLEWAQHFEALST